MISPTQENEVMRSVIAYLTKNTLLGNPWETMTPTEQLALTSTYFLLDRNPEKPQNTAAVFTQTILRRLLAQLTRQTRRHPREYQGQVRGRILWPVTLKSRYAKGDQLNTYICQESRRYYDTPANQLVKYMVESINHDLKMVPSFIRGGFCYIPAQDSWQAIAPQLTAIESVLNLCRQSMHLREITLPSVITHEHLLSAQNTDSEVYLSTIDLYKRCQNLRKMSDVNMSHNILILPNQVNNITQNWIKVAGYYLSK